MVDEHTRPQGPAVGVLVVDDQPAFRSAVRVLIEHAPGFVLVGEADSGEASVAAARRLVPGLVLMDVNLPGISGIEAARRIVAAGGPVVVLMSTAAVVDLPADAHTCGAAAYVQKADLTTTVLAAAWHRHGW